jgi:hypothetical protein
VNNLANELKKTNELCCHDIALNSVTLKSMDHNQIIAEEWQKLLNEELSHLSPCNNYFYMIKTLKNTKILIFVLLLTVV